MGLLNKKNIKNVICKSLLKDYINRGYKDIRLWTGYSYDELESMPASEFSGKSSKHTIKVGDVVQNRTNALEYLPVVVVGLRHIKVPNNDGVTWVVDYIYDESISKTKNSKIKDFTNTIFSACAQDLFL